MRGHGQGEWAMRDSSGCAFDTVNAGSAAVTGGQRVAHGVAPMQLSDAVKLLIERSNQQINNMYRFVPNVVLLNFLLNSHLISSSCKTTIAFQGKQDAV